MLSFREWRLSVPCPNKVKFIDDNDEWGTSYSTRIPFLLLASTILIILLFDARPVLRVTDEGPPQPSLVRRQTVSVVQDPYVEVSK